MKFLLTLICASAGAVATAAPVPQWSVHELTLRASRDYSNPYVEANVSARIQSPSGATIRVDGFWAGGREFRVRFTPTERGRWTWKTESADPGLNAKSGSFDCGPAARGQNGFLRTDPEHPHGWVRDDGTRFFMLGQTYYEILATIRAGGNWREAVDQSMAHGLNKIRFRMHVKTCGNRENPHPCREWWTGDKDHVDLEQFEAADQLVRYLDSKSMIADLMPFDSSRDAYGTPDQDQRFLRYMVARYAAFPSVIWCLTNEFQRAGREVAYLNQLGGMLRDLDPYVRGARPGALRGLSIHPLGGMGQGDRWKFADQTWPAHVILQIGRWTPGDPKLYGVMLSNREFGKPVVNDEFGYMGDSALWRGPNGDRGQGKDYYTRDAHRQSLWAIYMAGTWASDGDKYMYEDGRPYKTSLWHPAAEYADDKALVDLFTTKGLEYWRMEPAPDVVSGAERVYCLAWPGRQYLFYTAGGDSFQAKLAEGTYKATLFDPRTGAEKRLADVHAAAGRAMALHAPEDRNDWVIYLMSATR